MNHLFKSFKSTASGLFFGTVAFLFLANTAQASTFVVDGTTDANLTACTLSPNDCSLRGAMNNANSNLGADTITFNIPGSGYKTIASASVLPTLTDSGTFIDGNSQPGYVNAPRVVLSGAQAPSSFSTNGLNIATSNCRVRGLIFQNWRSAIGISGTSAHSNIIEGCFIGTDATGLDAPVETRNIRGITLLDGAHDNIIGGVKRNVITGNVEFGILISGTGSDRNSVAGNIIGLNARGELLSRIVGNGIGIVIDSGAKRCFIGSPDVALRNVISSNGIGVQLNGAQTAFHTLINNYIGTDPTGNKAGFGNDQAGVSINDAHSSRIGVPGAPRNVISGNKRLDSPDQFANNIELRGSHRNVIQNNFIGLKADGSGPMLAPVASLSLSAGIFLHSTRTSSTNLPCEGNLIGGTEPGARNVISGNTNFGICLLDAVGTRIQGNFIGTNPSGTAGIPNMLYGIYDVGAGTLIGGHTPQARNVISGNGVAFDPSRHTGGIASGFSQISSGAFRNITGNFIGTNAQGTGAIPNANGVLISGGNINLGGATNRPGTGSGNLISGNLGSGVIIGRNAPDAPGGDIRVLGNLIGTDLRGTTALPNRDGIRISGDGIRIGSGQSSGRNIISGNNGPGVLIDVEFQDVPTNNVVSGNYIGTDISGQSALPNIVGVQLQSGSDNIIGGRTNRPGSGTGNLISGNSVAGVYSRRSAGSFNAFYGNAIGVAANGSTPLPNRSLEGRGGWGVNLESAATTIGAPGDFANRIAHNEADGVAVVVESINALANSIRGNQIFNNGGLGIDLGDDGVTINDDGDADEGANQRQNFPVLTSAGQNTSGQLVLSGTLNSTPNRLFAVDVYASSTDDHSGNGEGEIYLGSFNVGTRSGTVQFQQTLDTDLDLSSYFITATATDYADKNTSEFSQAITANFTVDMTSASATAYASNSSLVLTFAEDIESVQSDNFAIRKDGVDIQAKNVMMSGRTLTFLLPPDSLEIGDGIQISWRNLFTQSRKSLSGRLSLSVD
jgi:hypothetical protein